MAATRPTPQQIEEQLPQRPRRSPEEVRRDLEALAAAQQKAMEAAKKEEPVKEAPKEPPKEESAAQETQSTAVTDDVDWEAVLNEKRQYNSKEVRTLLESLLEPMKVEDLVTKGEIIQRNVIFPNVIEAEFRSITAAEHLEIMRMMSDMKGSDRYILDKFSLMTLTCGLYSINGHPLPNHMAGEPPKFDEELFNRKYSFAIQYPIALVTAMSISYSWFDERVRDLLVVEKLGNG